MDSLPTILPTYHELSKFVDSTSLKTAPYGKRFLIFEGIDGSGKTEVIKELSRYLINAGSKVEIVRQPGYTEVGEYIRTLLKTNSSLDVATEILLMEASRIEMAKAMNSKLKSDPDTVFLMDRHVDSTFVHQVCDGDNPETLSKFYDTLKALVASSDIHRVNGLPEFLPYGEDLSFTFFLDVDPKESFNRCNSRKCSVSNRKVDRFDVADVERRTELRSRYVSRILANPHKYVIVDANRPFEEVLLEVAGLSLILTRDTL